jgi:hypothetical protein
VTASDSQGTWANIAHYAPCSQLRKYFHWRRMSSSVVLRLLNPAVQNQLLERLNKCGQLTFFHHRNYKLQEHFPCIIITITVNAVRAVFILPHVSNTRWHCSQTRSTLYWTSSHHLPSSNLVQTPQTMSTSQKVQPSLIHTPVIANFDSKPIPSSGDIKQHRVHSGFALTSATCY